jgi:hypothetical protein
MKVIYYKNEMCKYRVALVIHAHAPTHTHTHKMR